MKVLAALFVFGGLVELVSGSTAEGLVSLAAGVVLAAMVIRRAMQ